MRPLAGVAVAAAVALVGIFGLQQTTGVDDDNAAAPDTAVAGSEGGYTVPQAVNEQLRQYYLLHGAAATEFGANGINSRFVSLRISEEAPEEPAPEDDEASAESADTQPTKP